MRGPKEGLEEVLDKGEESEEELEVWVECLLLGR